MAKLGQYLVTIRKSTALRTVAGEYFTDELADLGSKDAAMQTR